MFATGALGPVHYAGQCILASRVEEGLRELAVENLRGGFSRGLLQAAQRVGVTPREIESALPMAEVTAILARVAVTQPAAVDAWKRYAGGIGGLLAGVADLTVDGRAPDTALAVQRLSKKVLRDKPLSEPLAALANDLFDLQDLLQRCVDALNDTAALEKAYRRRRMKRLVAVGAMISLAVGAIAAIVWIRVARAKVLAVIERPDPCAAAELTEADLSRVSDDLRDRAKKNVEACEAARAAEAKRKEDERLKEERDREAKKREEAREAACDAFATHLGEGKLTPDDEKLAGDAAALFGRISKGALDLGDYGPADPPEPCKGTKASSRVEAAFQKAVLAKPWNLPKVDVPSAAVTGALAKGGADLPNKLKAMMGTRAGDAAKKAIAAGKPEQITRALALCETAKALGTAPTGPCDGVKAIQKK